MPLPRNASTSGTPPSPSSANREGVAELAAFILRPNGTLLHGSILDLDDGAAKSLSRASLGTYCLVLTGCDAASKNSFCSLGAIWSALIARSALAMASARILTSASPRAALAPAESPA